jgi:hypothetical protein
VNLHFPSHFYTFCSCPPMKKATNATDWATRDNCRFRLCRNRAEVSLPNSHTWQQCILPQASIAVTETDNTANISYETCHTCMWLVFHNASSLRKNVLSPSSGQKIKSESMDTHSAYPGPRSLYKNHIFPHSSIQQRGAAGSSETLPSTNPLVVTYKKTATFALSLPG